MADAYLNIAEMVLSAERRPLRPREILQCAHMNELLPWHLHGKRQDKTLHARLSEDISRNPERSRFYRTAPGVFYLSELRGAPDTPEAYRESYLAPPRRKELNRSKIFSISLSDLSEIENNGEVSVSEIRKLLTDGRYEYRSLSDIANSEGNLIVNSFVIVFRGDKVLSFRCGKFFPSHDPLYGRRSIGVGSAVEPDNVDLLYESMFGIVESGIEELGYGIGLPQRLAERARYNGELVPCLAIVPNPPQSGPAVVHIVMAYRCPDEFEPSKAALSVNDLRWVDASNPGNDLEDYDSTSRHLFFRRRVEQIVRGQLF